MEWLFLAFGVLLILIGLADLFLTMLHPDGFGFLSIRLYKRLFDAVRFLTCPLPRKFRAFGLSMAAPLMVPAAITVWMVLVLTG